ncbi:MAG: peptidoglycan glycosyltransferase [Eubacterium sp.]|nr:peptidoglycan glycosyltransferase [Eubacterium sp.]
MLFVLLGLGVVIGKLVKLMIFDSQHYEETSQALHEREREIKAARGRILDRNGIVLADNKSVCTVSVIYNQIEEPEQVIELLCRELGLGEEEVRKKVEKLSSRECIKSNVPQDVGERIRQANLAGVKVDEDYKRYYPFDELASKVLGFTGGDNQGIIGLEVVYDKYLQGESGMILTLTDAAGIEIKNASERRKDPVDGNDLTISMDYNMQKYAMQAAHKVMEEKNADSVSVILMNPQNGELYAMANVPEFNLNQPYELPESTVVPAGQEEFDLLNQMWRNGCINDTYEPGSTFKIITSAAALEADVVKLDDSFFCPGYIMVEDRRIRCHKAGGHGSEDFVHGIMNSCNPVFIDVGLRLGTDRFYDYFNQFGLLEKTNVDLPGEAGTIMHKKENIGQVELATISFGQSFQITPLKLAATVSGLINGGNLVTPHFGVSVQNKDGETVKTFEYESKEGIVSEETSETMRYLLEQVVSEGSGKNAAIAGFSIGGKTATSQTLPRSAKKYISSFLGFAPAENPQILGLIVIRDPQGVYYGGTIAAPVMKEIFENVLPYLGVERKEIAEEAEEETAAAGY